MSKLRIIGAIPPLPLNDFMACTRRTLHSKKKYLENLPSTFIKDFYY